MLLYKSGVEGGARTRKDRVPWRRRSTRSQTGRVYQFRHIHAKWPAPSASRWLGRARPCSLIGGRVSQLRGFHVSLRCHPFESEGVSIAGPPSGSSNTDSEPGSGLPANHQPLPGMLRNSSALERRAARVATSFFPPTGMSRRRTSDKISLSLTGVPRSSKRERTAARVCTVTAVGCLTPGARSCSCFAAGTMGSVIPSRLSASSMILKSLSRLASSALSCDRAEDTIAFITASVPVWRFNIDHTQKPAHFKDHL